MISQLPRWGILCTLLVLAARSACNLFGQQCGVERWSVKTGSDADAAKVDLRSATTTTISYLTSLPAPAPIPPTSRVPPTETTVWVLNATLTGFKLENDSDTHLVIDDGSAITMIAEIPSPDCVCSQSPVSSAIANAHGEFSSQFNAGPNFQDVKVPVQIKGVGMFDFLHGQRGLAPNGIELHPVLDIVFNPGADFSISASPASFSVGPGGTTTLSISTTASGAFGSPLSISSSGSPAGVTVTFSPTSIAVPGTAVATVNVDPSTAPGTSTLALTASAGGITHTTNVTLTVTSAAIPDFPFSASPSSLCSVPGSSASTTLSAAVVGGFNSDISLSASGLPAGLNANFSVATIAAPGAGSSLVTITVNASTAPGNYTIPILASGGGTTHTASLSVSVSTPGTPGAPAAIITEANRRRALAASRELEAAAALSTLRGDDDNLIQIVPSEEATTLARRHGGRAICHPQQHNIFLGSAWADRAQQSRKSELSDLIVAPSRGLCAGASRVATPVSQDEPVDLAPGTSLSDLQIELRLATMLREGRLKPPKSNELYVVFLPPGVQSTVGTAVGEKDYFAYHSHVHLDQGQARYVVVPYASSERREVTATARALAQAVHNPEGTVS